MSERIILLLSAFYLASISIGCQPHGQSIKIDNGELFFTPAVADTTMQKSVQYLKEVGYFTHSSGSVQIDHKNGVDIFRIVVKPEMLKDSATQTTLRDFGRLIQKDLFPYAPFVLHACNAEFRTLKAYKFSSAIRQ